MLETFSANLSVETQGWYDKCTVEEVNDMAFDGMMVYAITNELRDELEKGRISKVYQPYERDLIFHIRAKGQKKVLLLSANPTYPRIHLTEESFENPLEAPQFCMLLRKHLEGGIIQSIRQVGMERMIHVEIKSKNELGDEHVKRLVIELMGRHSNIILVDPKRNIILDSIHHVSHAINQHRAVLPGRPYVAPPDQNKINPFTVDRGTFLKKMDFNRGKLEQQIVDRFEGVSPLLAKEILYLAGLPHRESLSNSFVEMMNRIHSKRFDPVLIRLKEKTLFYLFPLEHAQGETEHFSTLSHMLERYFHGKAEREQVKQKANDLLRFLTNEKKKNEKKIKKLEQTRKESEQAERYKLYGELLTAYMHQFQKGDESVEVINYYDEEGSMLEIPLDPQKSPNENAQKYFKLYQKAKKSVLAVDEQIRLAQEEIRYMETLLQQLEQASPSDVEDIRDELVEGGYLKKRAAQKKKKKVDQPKLETYRSSEGVTILVGKNNKQNEYLTNRVAHSSDTWLHTKDIPGSHVVIRANSFSSETLKEAAEIAAYFSKARQSSQVPVDYTLIKHVRKPSGAKPGYVIYERQQTIYVTPQEATIRKLKKC